MEVNLQLKTRLMLQTPVRLKKLSTGQDSRCGVREREGILRTGNLSKNVQNKRPERGAWSGFLSLPGLQAHVSDASDHREQGCRKGGKERF